MPSEFDPYYYFLGIPPKDQPPDYYRLLGLERFESNLEVIEGAADRQMAHLQRHESGEHVDAVAKLLGEVSRARLCLLKLKKKAAYDKKLEAQLASREQDQAAAEEAVLLSPVDDAEPVLLSPADQEDPQVLASPLDQVDLPQVEQGLFPGSEAGPAEARPATGTGEHFHAEQPPWKMLLSDWRIAAAALAGSGVVAVIFVLAIAWLFMSDSEPSGAEQAGRSGRTASVQPNGSRAVTQTETRASRFASTASDEQVLTGWPEQQVKAGTKVAWTGRLQEVRVVEEDRRDSRRLHVLLAATNAKAAIGELEGYTLDVNFARELADFVALVEDPEQADTVTLQGEVASSGVFPRLAGASDVPLVEIEAVGSKDGKAKGVVGQRRPIARLSDQQIARVTALRTPGWLARYPVKVVATHEDQDLWLVGTVDERRVQVRVPRTWASEFQTLQINQTVPVLASRAQTAPGRAPSRARELILEAHAVNQPSFSEVQADPGRYAGSPLRLAAHQILQDCRGTHVTLEVAVLDADSAEGAVKMTTVPPGYEFPNAGVIPGNAAPGAVKMTGNTTLAGIESLATIRDGELVDVEFRVTASEAGAAYWLVSYVPRDRPDAKIAFDVSSPPMDGTAPGGALAGKEPPASPAMKLTVPLVELLGHAAPVTNMSWSPKRSDLAVVDGDGAMKMWSLTGGAAVQSNTLAVVQPCWSPSGKFVLAKCSGDFYVHSTSQAEALGSVSTQGVAAWLFGDWLLTNDSSYRYPFRHPERLTAVVKSNAETRGFYALAVSPHGDRLVSCEHVASGLALNIRSLSVGQGGMSLGINDVSELTLPVPYLVQQLWWFAGTTDSLERIAALGDRQITVWRFAEYRLSDVRQTVIDLSAAMRGPGTAPGYGGGPYGIKPAEDEALYEGRRPRGPGINEEDAGEGGVRETRIPDGFNLRRLIELGDSGPTFRHDGLLFAQANDSAALIYDTATGRIAAQKPGNFWRLAFAPTGDLIAMANGSTGRIDTTAGELAPLVEIESPSPITALAWHPDATFLATGHLDCRVRIWDLRGLASSSEDKLTDPKQTRCIFDLDGVWKVLLDFEDRSAWHEFHELVKTLERKAPLKPHQKDDLGRLKARVIKRAEGLVKQAVAARKAAGDRKTPQVISLLEEASQCDPHGRYGDQARKLLRDRK